MFLQLILDERGRHARIVPRSYTAFQDHDLNHRRFGLRLISYGSILALRRSADQRVFFYRPESLTTEALCIFCLAAGRRPAAA